jgi:hypothetical protein
MLSWRASLLISRCALLICDGVNAISATSTSAPPAIHHGRRASPGASRVQPNTPAQIKSAHREMSKLARQESIEGDLLALVKDGTVNLRCGPVGVPNHAPVPLLALYLEASPARIVSAQSGSIGRGQYLDPASKEVEADYVLDPHDPHEAVDVPPGFVESHANRSWLVFQRCA